MAAGRVATSRHMPAQPPPEVIKVKTVQVACDGSGEVAPALGHPRVYLGSSRTPVSSNAVTATAASSSRADRLTSRHDDAGDPRQFLYRNLDPDSARRLAQTHLAPHDDGELYLQYAASEAFGFDDGRLKTADYHSSSGFGLRAVSGETTAFAHANEISEAAIERAAVTLKLLDPRTASPSPQPQRTNQSMYGADDPLGLVPFAEKVGALPADRCCGSRP